MAMARMACAIGRSAAATLLALVMVLGRPVTAETPAGTVVTNVARLSVTMPDGAHDISSNPVALTIAERLDATLTRSGAGQGPVAIVEGGAVVPFVLANTGNGQEAFVLIGSPTDATVTIRTMAIDVDGDGRFDPARDEVIADGRSPVLAPGAMLSLLVVIDAATTPVTATSFSLVASAATGSGAPGTVYASRGDGGSDAVTGATGGSARIDVPIGAATTAPTLVKSQVVRAPDGSASAVFGAIVTYTLEARFPGLARDARIADPIPAGTAYVAGTLTLDGTALSDATDTDEGDADTGGIAVRLGDIAAPAVRTVTFQVKIQ